MRDEPLAEVGGSPSVFANRKSGLALLGVDRSAISSVILFCLFVWLAFSWFETVERILRCYTAVPNWDYWRVALYAPLYRAMDFRVLWRQHNEHRIVFPEIIYALDVLVWHGRRILPLALSFVCYFSTWIVLAWTLISDRLFPRPVRNAAILMAGIVIGWNGSALVLASPFLLQWTMIQLCVFLSLAFINRAKNARTNTYLLLTIASAVVATYSSGNGMLLWVPLIAAGFVLRLRKRDMAVLGITGFLSVALYFVGYKFSNELNIKNLVAHPVYFLGYLGAYLSMPFGGLNPTRFGVFVGLSSLLITIILFVTAARAGLLPSRPGIVLFGAYSFTLLTCVITAAGRMDSSDPTFASAKPDRYLTVPLVTWAVFISLCVWVAARCRWKIASPSAITFIVAVLAFAGFLELRSWVQKGNRDFSNAQLAALSFEDGLTDPGVIRKIFPDPGLVINCLPYLHEQNLSVFHRSRIKWLGASVERFSPVLNTAATGEIAYTFPVRSGLEVFGWADEYSRGAQYEWIVLTNELGQIIGFGRRLPAGLPSDLRSSRIPSSLGWVGFVNLQIKTNSLSAYVVHPDRKGLLAIAGSLPVPQVQAAGLKNLGSPIPAIEWKRDPAWTLGGYPPPSRFDDLPPQPIYSSWSGKDSGTREMISSVFPVPANNCMILPVLHGPLIAGLSAEILDADTGKSIQAAPFQLGDLQWEYWRIPFDAAVRHLRVKAENQGPDVGEWLALGPPSECR